MPGDHIAWPLGPRQHQLVTELASLVERGGAWRLLHAPVVAPTPDDYPDPWHEDRAGVAAVVARTLWHAHLELEPVIEDVRAPDARSTKRLRSTSVRLTGVTDTRAVFEVSSIGNDDVAGEISHQVGRAFVAWLGRTGAPFRTSDDDGLPALAFGSLATIYLGLGVVAANSAHYDRSAGDVRGSLSRHEHGIAHAGDLEWQELAFLLAVQATVRDDVLTALDALRPSQAEEVAAWRALLDDHEAELVELLGIADDGEPVTRGAAPRAPTTTGAIDERDLHKQNYGQRVFRVRGTRGSVGGAVGLASGAVVGTAVAVGVGAIAILPIAITVACIGGVLYGRRKHYFRCASCQAFVNETDAECHMCGGRIHSTIANASDRLDREEELERSERDQRRPL